MLATDLDPLFASATLHGGVLTRKDAVICGVGDYRLSRLLRAGLVHRVRRDAYVLAEVWRAAAEPERYRLRVRAVLRSINLQADDAQRVAASHHAALALAGVALWGHEADGHAGVIDVVADVSRSRTASGVRRHVATGPIPRGNLPAVPVADAVLQTLSWHGLAAAVVSADRALHTGLITMADLRQSAVGASAGGDARAIARFLDACDPGCPTVGASRARLLLHDFGLPPVRSRVRIPGTGVTADFLLGRGVLVQVDGQPGLPVGAQAAADARLRAAGYRVVRLSWADLSRPDTVNSKLRSLSSRCPAWSAAPGLVGTR